MEEGHPNRKEGSSCVSRSGENSGTLKHGRELFGEGKAGVRVRDTHWRQEHPSTKAGSSIEVTRNREEIVLMEKTRMNCSSNMGGKQGGTGLWKLCRSLNEA